MRKEKKVIKTPEQIINSVVEIVKSNTKFLKVKERFSALENLKSNPAIIEAFERLKINHQNKPKEYEAVYLSIANYLKTAQPEAHITPVAIEYFFNWWAFEKNGHMGPGELFATKIKQEDFIEYSTFKKQILNKERKPPFWYNKEDSKWLLPKSFREPKKETDYKTEILAYDYRRQVDPTLEFRNGAEWLRVKGGKGRIATVFSQIQKSKWKKDEKQLKKIIEFLNEFPEAQKLAIKDLEEI